MDLVNNSFLEGLGSNHISNCENHPGYWEPSTQTFEKSCNTWGDWVWAISISTRISSCRLWVPSSELFGKKIKLWGFKTGYECVEAFSRRVIKEQIKTSSKMQKQQISVSKQPKLFHSGAACAGEAAKCLLKKKSQMALKKSSYNIFLM